MRYTVHDEDDGAIQVHRFEGPLDLESLRALADAGPNDTSKNARVFLVDLTDADASGIDSSAVQALAGKSSGARARLQDFRPSVIAAASPVILGLANMLAAYRGEDVTVVQDSYESALDWARKYVRTGQPE